MDPHMDRVHAVWFAATAVVIAVVVAVVVGLLMGDVGLTVESVAATGETPANASANCDDVVVRQIDVRVELSRAEFGFRNPQWWGVGVSVRATVFESAESRLVTVQPGDSITVTIPFTNVRESNSVPSQRIEAVLQVVSGNVELASESATASFDPVTAGRNC